MVCVKSVKHLLDEFILLGNKRKVNGFDMFFTICLQPQSTQLYLFTKCSKIRNNAAIDSLKGVC